MGPAHRSRFRSRAAVIVTLAALPILWTPNVVVARKVVGGFRVAIPGALLFAADGWIATGYVFVWQIALTRCRATRPRGSPGLANPSPSRGEPGVRIHFPPAESHTNLLVATDVGFAAEEEVRVTQFGMAEGELDA